ncbi:MAG TPA: hypothetical protein VNN07_18040, partial [Candidatus Tectomicrobia bacterium]|nr:hypothetical protein [Candidatus Tectomicrobia bacterium]
TTRHDGRATLRIVPLSTDDLGVALERGGPSADRGWACVRDGEVVPAWVVRYQRRARTATFLTLLIADRPGERRDVAAAVEGIPFTEDCRVSVRGPDVAQEILIPAAAAPTESAR